MKLKSALPAFEGFCQIAYCVYMYTSFCFESKLNVVISVAWNVIKYDSALYNCVGHAALCE